MTELDVRALRLVGTAARSMATGMVIVDAASGRVVFKNEQVDRMFGRTSDDAFEVARRFDVRGKELVREEWPIRRALTGETVVEQLVDIIRSDGTVRALRISASPVHDDSGAIVAAVSTYHDVTDVRRTHAAARYLAEAGALLERFDPGKTLQAIVDLAVPQLADWCFVHLTVAGGLTAAAIAHADAAALAEARRLSTGVVTISAETAIARVLASGRSVLMQIGDDELRTAARGDADLARMKALGYRSTVVAPLVGRDGVIGTITFVMADSGRTYGEGDLDMLGELARRTGIAIENARLFGAEQQARVREERAHERTRRLQQLTAALSGTVEKQKVVSTLVEAGSDALGAGASFAWLLGDADTLELAAAHHDTQGYRIEDFGTIPMSAHLPVCDVIRTREPMLFETREAMMARHPSAVPTDSPYKSWAVMPLVLDGRAIGAASFSFEHERTFSAEDRELLTAMTSQAALALERCRLIEAERNARAATESARQRERQLHILAARLSSALTREQIATIACEEALVILGAVSCAASVRDGDEITILGLAGTVDEQLRPRYMRLPLAGPTPHAEAVRSGQLVWCSSAAELARRYASLEEVWRPRGIRSWGSVPFTFEDRIVGALSLTFTDERELAADNRDFLYAVGQLTAHALERARLYEAHRASEDQLRMALDAGRAATWSMDLVTRRTRRDPSYRRLVGVEASEAGTDFMSIHPDDRDIARDAFDRTLRDGTPYEPEVRVRRDDGTYMWIRSHARLLYDADGTPRGLAGVIVDIDDAKQTSLRADAERRINDTLHRLATMFASELDEDRLVRLITDEVSRAVGAELAVFRVDSRDAATSGDRALVPDLHASRLASVLAVPVARRSGELFGTLLLGHSQAGAFSEPHARLVASIASQTAVALDNARLYRTLREHKEQLEVAVERARVADRRKDEFLAMLGHELRNPLAPIATALELMELKGDQGLRKERDVIRRQVGHLSRLIEDLLDVSRITRGKIQLSREVVETSAVLAKAIEMTSPLLEKRMQRLTIDVPRSGMCVEADPTRLAQVFQNLLTNAAKYSDPQTTIELHARRERDAVIVEVSDRGVGIAPELLPRLFDLFVQGERALDRAQGGLGIGLSVAKSLCELHGGTIDAASAGTGHGSTFTVTLPRVERPQPAGTPSDERTTQAMRPLGNPSRVLVVDDNVDAATMLRDFLRAIGHEPAVAHDGPSALELASSFKPDIAVLDIGLPVMNGYELARRLRETLGDAKLRLIAVTGYGQEADRARSHEVGFEHHLTKPIELEMLLSLLGKSA